MSRFFIYLIFGFLSTFSFAYLYYKLTESNKKIGLGIIIIFVLGMVAETVIQFYDYTFLSILSFFIYFPFLFYCLNPIPIKKSFFYIMIVWLYGIIVDIIFILITSLVFYFLNYNYYKNNSEIISLFLTSCVSVTLILFGKIPFIKRITKKIYYKISKIRYFDLALIVFSVFIIVAGLTMFFNIDKFNVNVFSVLFIILVMFDFILFINYRVNAEESAKYLNTLKENNEFYIKMEDENRIFKHNLVAKLLSIKSVSNTKSMGLIEDLIEQFNKSIDFSRNMKVIPYGLNGIIYQKLYPWMKILKVEISNELDFDIFDMLKPRRYNVLVEKLVIALDNAIEACLKSEDKSLIINIYDDDNICIEIENTFGNDIDLDLLGNKNYSTKGYKHGLGLFSAFRNNEASLTVKVVNNVFISRIIAKKHPID